MKIYKYKLKREMVGEVNDHLMDSPPSVADYAREIIGDEEQEHLISIMLTIRNKVIGHYPVTVGLLDRSQAHAREVFRQAIIKNCSKIVIAHNHPSGDPSPSKGDKTITSALAEAGKIIGIEVVDHVIIGLADENHEDHYSFRKEGLL